MPNVYSFLICFILTLQASMAGQTQYDFFLFLHSRLQTTYMDYKVKTNHPTNDTGQKRAGVYSLV